MANAQLPELGVGVVYSSGLEPLLAAHPELVDVLELEPQTTWTETGDPGRPYGVPAGVVEHLVELPGAKLVHSVGTPVGGSQRAHAAQVPLLREYVTRLDAPWASEHLAFNLTRDFFTGFFLPPRQTERGVFTYVQSIAQLRDALGVPLAIETAVNYLRPRSDEVPDGEFVAAVAEGSDCGVLLDLHNIYCNERNGRQSIDRFLSALPLERVWEVHVAGGFEMDGYWLDAHSGAIPAPLEYICREVIPSLPKLKAIIFEIFPSYLQRFGLDATREQLEKLRELWGQRRTIRTPSTAAAHLAGTSHARADRVPPATWEQALGSIVIGRPARTPLESELAADPGSVLMKGLVQEFRASMVVSVYRLTCRLLMLALGTDVFRMLLDDFWSTSSPRQFASAEAEDFAEYLTQKGVHVPQLLAVLSFERATLATLRDGTTRTVRFQSDPFPLLRALAEGRLPTESGTPGEYEIELRDEGAVLAPEHGPAVRTPQH